MSTNTESLSMALAVLKDATSFMTKKSRDQHSKAVSALEAALASAPAQPVSEALAALDRIEQYSFAFVMSKREQLAIVRAALSAQAAPKVPELPDEKINVLIDEIDQIATDYDMYEYGLPCAEEPRSQMRDSVRTFFSAHAAPSPEAKAQAVPTLNRLVEALRTALDHAGVTEKRAEIVGHFCNGLNALFSAAPQPATSEQDPDGWCQYVAGMIVAYLGGGVDDERIKPIAGIIQRRLWALRPATSEQRKPLTDEQYIDAANAYIERCEGHDGSSDELHALLFNTFCAGAKWAIGIRSTGGEHE